METLNKDCIDGGDQPPPFFISFCHQKDVYDEIYFEKRYRERIV